MDYIFNFKATLLVNHIWVLGSPVLGVFDTFLNTNALLEKISNISENEKKIQNEVFSSLLERSILSLNIKFVIYYYQAFVYDTLVLFFSKPHFYLFTALEAHKKLRFFNTGFWLWVVSSSRRELISDNDYYCFMSNKDTVLCETQYIQFIINHHYLLF